MFLLDNMMLFFIPVGVGLITSYTLLSRYMLAIIVASLVSTVLVIAVVGLVEQKLESKKRSKKKMMIKEIADSQVFLLTLTVGVYIGAIGCAARSTGRCCIRFSFRSSC